jgi:hypothetical protein
MRPEFSSVLKSLIVLVVVVAGISAFSFCAESPADACMLACCGGADRARPLGRVARFVGCARSWLAATLFSPLALGARRPQVQLASTFSAPALLAGSSLRI